MAQSDFESLAAYHNEQTIYEPDNVIPDEVLALIAAYELSNTTGLPDGKDPDVTFVLQPAECMSDSVPPKRFPRTFWRSALRRILALQSTQTMIDGVDTGI